VGRASKRRTAFAVARALCPAVISIAFFGVAGAAPALALGLPADASQLPSVPAQAPSAGGVVPISGDAGPTASSSNAPSTPVESPRRASPPASSTPSLGSRAPASRAPPPPRTVRTLLETTVHAVEADVSGAPAGSQERPSGTASPASSAKSTSATGVPARPSATTLQKASSVVGIAGSTTRSAALPSADRATVDRGTARSARASSERPSGPTSVAAGHGATSVASASRLTTSAGFDFRAPSQHGLTASAPSHGSLLSDVAPAGSGLLLALLLVLASAIGGTVVVLSGVGRRPRVRDWRRRAAAVRRTR